MELLVSTIIEKGNRDVNSAGGRVEDADWYDYITRALNDLMKGRTLPWQKRETTIDIYSNVFKYPLPSDFSSFIKPGEALGVYPESIHKTYTRPQEFYTNDNMNFALSWERDTEYLLARLTGTADLKFEGFDDEASEYTIAGDGSNGQKDTTNFREGTGSLRFDILDATNETTIVRNKSGVIDISEFINLGKLFTKLYMPTAITSVSIKYGNDSANYYEISAVTAQFTNDDFEAGAWNEIAFDMQNTVETGVVDNTNIDYFEVIIDNTGVTDTNFRIDGLDFRLPTNLRMPYNANKIIEKASGSDIYLNTVDAGVNAIIWGQDWQELLQWKVNELVSMFKFRDTELANYCKMMYESDIIDFNNRYPSEEARNSNTYYRQANKF